MAWIRSFKKKSLGKIAKHSDAKCTYTIFTDPKRGVTLQIDTYGSSGRILVGKKSQSIRIPAKLLPKFKKIVDAACKK